MTRPTRTRKALVTCGLSDGAGWLGAEGDGVSPGAKSKSRGSGSISGTTPDNRASADTSDETLGEDGRAAVNGPSLGSTLLCSSSDANSGKEKPAFPSLRILYPSRTPHLHLLLQKPNLAVSQVPRGPVRLQLGTTLHTHHPDSACTRKGKLSSIR